MDRNGAGGRGVSRLSTVGFLFLSLNCVLAAYSSRDDPWAVGFIVFAYLDLLLLFHCLRLLERPGPPGRRLFLKVAVWSIATSLTAAFAYKVAAIMPWWGAAGVWAMALATITGGFLAFFVYYQGD